MIKLLLLIVQLILIAIGFFFIIVGFFTLHLPSVGIGVALWIIHLIVSCLEAEEVV